MILMERKNIKIILKDYILLPVIIVCAIGGTVGMLCTIQKLFPYAGKYVEKTKEWINKNQ